MKNTYCIQKIQFIFNIKVVKSNELQFIQFQQQKIVSKDKPVFSKVFQDFTKLIKPNPCLICQPCCYMHTLMKNTLKQNRKFKQFWLTQIHTLYLLLFWKNK